MNAEEAKQLQDMSSLQSTIDAIDAGIDRAARRGEDHMLPLGCVPGERRPVNQTDKRLLMKHYVGRGFVWNYHGGDAILSW